MAISIIGSRQGAFDIPNFVRASSAAGLRRAMLLNNKRLKAFITYQDIQLNPKDGNWYAWYYVDFAKDEAELQPLVGGDNG